MPAPVLGLAPLGTAGHARAVAELAIWLSQTVCRVRDRDHYRGHNHIAVLRATPSPSPRTMSIGRGTITWPGQGQAQAKCGKEAYARARPA